MGPILFALALGFSTNGNMTKGSDKHSIVLSTHSMAECSFYCYDCSCSSICDELSQFQTCVDTLCSSGSFNEEVCHVQYPTSCGCSFQCPSNCGGDDDLLSDILKYGGVRPRPSFQSHPAPTHFPLWPQRTLLPHLVDCLISPGIAVGSIVGLACLAVAVAKCFENEANRTNEASRRLAQ
jgi:hypothetical protein